MFLNRRHFLNLLVATVVISALSEELTAMALTTTTTTYSLIPLPYPYDALEPYYIDTETMRFHHDKGLAKK